jgi:uncharacterized protein (DUF934 family)
MPRRLLRNAQIVDDDWSYTAEAEGNAAAPLILTLVEWQTRREEWVVRGGKLGVVLQPADGVQQVSSDLPLLSLIACSFTGPSEGRGYSQARMLREQLKFSGELRATGYVRRDQLFFLARCGFDSFELAEADLQHAATALSTFSAAYQPSNDAGLPFKLQHRS